MVESLFGFYDFMSTNHNTGFLMLPNISAFLRKHNFRKTISIVDSKSIADRFESEAIERCGIYVLHFADGQFYVGKAGNVVQRFSQHCRTWDDIVKVSFKKIAAKNLDKYEQKTVRVFEDAGYQLRNINLVTLSYGDTLLEDVMSKDEQQKWINNPDYIDSSGTRPVNDELRDKYHKRFQAFLKKPLAEDAIAIANAYVRTCIPAYKKTEGRFWSVSCMPQKNIYIRINIGWQEAFNVFWLDDRLTYRWFISRQLASFIFQLNLDDVIDERLIGITYPDFPEIELAIWQARYTAGSPDQVCIFAPDIDSAQFLIDDKGMRVGVRTFNLGLMQKRPTTYGRYHCFDLADRLIID